MAEPSSLETLDRPISDTPWINFRDPGSPDLDTLAAREGFHPLEIEDCRHRNQVAKIIEHEEYTFIVIKAIRFDEARLDLEFDDFDLFVKPALLVTVQEKECRGLVERVVPRMRTSQVRHRPWRLAHALLDIAVDDYLPVLDRIGDLIDDLQNDVLQRPSPETL